MTTTKSTILLLLIHLLHHDHIESNPLSHPLTDKMTQPFKQDIARDFTPNTSINTPQRDTMLLRLYTMPINDEDNAEACPLVFQLDSAAFADHVSTHSTVISTPTILPSKHGDGKRIVFHAMRETLEVLTTVNADVTAASTDFPLLFEGSIYHGSPVVQDVDGDGVEDVIMVDFDGRVSVVQLFEQLKSGSGSGSSDEKDEHPRDRHWGEQIPRLLVRKDWFDDASVNGEGEESAAAAEDEEKKNKMRFSEPFHSYFEWDSEWKQKRSEDLANRGTSADKLDSAQSRKRRRLEFEAAAAAATVEQREGGDPHRRLEEKGEEGEYSKDVTAEAHEEAVAALLEELPDNGIKAAGHYDTTDDGVSREFRGGDDMSADDVWQERPEPDGPTDDEDYAYAGHHHHHDGYGDDYYGHYNQYQDDGYFMEDNYVALDPHVLTSPTVAYLNMRSNAAHLILPVSYFFEPDEYKHAKEEDLQVPRDQLGNFVASALMMYSFDSRRWTTQEHLDLSTDGSDGHGRRAFTYNTPTVADLDGDGKMEIIIGTSFGLLYIMNEYGIRKSGFPIQMGEIHAQVAVADVTGNPNLELFAADMDGNVLCLDSEGETVWHYNVTGPILRAPKLGDVNGDGILDVVVVSKRESIYQGDNAYYVWAFEAASGNLLDKFPFAVKDSRESPASLHPEVLLVDLHADQDHWLTKARANSDSQASQTLDGKAKGNEPANHGGNGQGLHIIIPANKHMFIFEGSTGCVSKIDIGEDIRSMVLADDVSGDGKLELLATTMNGEVLTFRTPLPAHPLNTWTSPLRSRVNGFVHGYSSPVSIVVHEKSRQFRDILGFLFPITFEIFDRRKLDGDYRPKYTVAIGEGTSNKKLRFRKEYNETGVYTERISLPEGGKYTTLVVTLVTEHGLQFEETFTIGYNVNYGQGIEWLITLPLMIAAIPLLLYKRNLTIDGPLLGTTVLHSRID